jgi:hypothetical protein
MERPKGNAHAGSVQIVYRGLVYRSMWNGQKETLMQVFKAFGFRLQWLGFVCHMRRRIHACHMVLGCSG